MKPPFKPLALGSSELSSQKVAYWQSQDHSVIFCSLDLFRRKTCCGTLLFLVAFSALGVKESIFFWDPHNCFFYTVIDCSCGPRFRICSCGQCRRGRFRSCGWHARDLCFCHFLSISKLRGRRFPSVHLIKGDSEGQLCCFLGISVEQFGWAWHIWPDSGKGSGSEACLHALSTPCGPLFGSLGLFNLALLESVFMPFRNLRLRMYVALMKMVSCLILSLNFQTICLNGGCMEFWGTHYLPGSWRSPAKITSLAGSRARCEGFLVKSLYR